MDLPVARQAAQDMVLELQAEAMVRALLDELYVQDVDRGVYRWGRDVPFEAVPLLVERLTNRVVYDK